PNSPPASQPIHPRKFCRELKVWLYRQLRKQDNKAAEGKMMSEWFTSIGALVGWLSGLFLLYDRFAKGRPTASFAVKGKYGCIRITNIGDYDIAVVDACVKPKVYFLTEDMEVGTLLGGAEGQRPTFMLRPREEKELFIAPLYTNG